MELFPRTRGAVASVQFSANFSYPAGWSLVVNHRHEVSDGTMDWHHTVYHFLVWDELTTLISAVLEQFEARSCCSVRIELDVAE